jgi:hypothetical protein
VIAAEKVLGGIQACVPAGVTPSQLQEIVVTFLRGHVAQRQETAGILVPVALSLSFPCGK